jgi:hypothetical protein
MSYGELIAGFRGLIRRVTDDAAICERVRNKLRHMGRAPAPFRLPPGRTLRYLVRFLAAGVARGGVRRWGYFARSLAPAVRDPRLLPAVILNWTYGLAIQAFVAELLAEPGEGGADRDTGPVTALPPALVSLDERLQVLQ